MGRLVLLVPITLALTACMSNLEAKKMPGTDLSAAKTIYVQKLTADEHGVDQLITNQLTRMGY